MAKFFFNSKSYVGLVSGLFLAGAMVVFIPNNAQSQISNNNPQAEELLENMTSYLRDSQNFSFTADITQDHPLREGQKITRGAITEFSVKRPNQLRADYDGDVRDVSFYYDGTNFTMVEANKDAYAVIPLTSDLNGLFDTIENDYGFTLPMGSLISTDLYSVITEKMTSSDYLGLANIRGTSCHHLAFRLEEVDLQIWVADGEKPLPCKFVVTYKNEEGYPEYTAVFSDWDFRAYDPKDPRFTVELPANVHQVQILPSRLGKEE